MKLILSLIYFCLCSQVFCQNFIERKQKYITAIPNTSKTLEIPTYEDIPDKRIPYVYWHYSKQKEKQLNLVSLENDSLATVFRLWITEPFSAKNQTQGLIEIIYDSLGYRGQLILMYVDFNYKKVSETITSSKVVNLSPKSLDWSILMDSLVQYKIRELPTDDKIPGYYTKEDLYNNNAITYAFEFSTPTKYRFFQYSNIKRSINNFSEPQYVDKILRMLDTNFEWTKIGHEYYKRN